MQKLTAMDIANFFVQLSDDLTESDMTNLKLNKLCYYAQGWSLAKLGRPLFGDEIQAWKFGPVIPEVYRSYKSHGNEIITRPTHPFDEKKLSTDELNLLIDVYSTYGKYTAVRLKDMTHVPDGPWAKVYEEGKNRPITVESIKKYFQKSKELETFKVNATPENVVNYG